MATQKSTQLETAPSDFCFVQQLRGENPPSLATMKALYDLALLLFAIRPWELLQENQVIVVRPPGRGDDCYCSVMGAIGQVFSVHAYVGAESFALFQRIVSGVEMEPADFVADRSSVYVEFVPKKELEAPDRQVLSALGLTTGKGVPTPIFRAGRPGYHPWFVTAEEAAQLGACLSVVASVCSEIVRTGTQRYWSRGPGLLPLFEPEGDSWQVNWIEAAAPAEQPVPAARLTPEQIAGLRSQNYPRGGPIEIDYFATMSAVGEKNERKASTGMALAVDATNGWLFPPGITSPPDPADALANVLVETIQSGKAFPSEIRVRSTRLEACIAGVAQTLAIPVRVVRRLPELAQARRSMRQFFGG